MPAIQAEEAQIALIVAELGCQMCEKKVLEIVYRKCGEGPVKVFGAFRMGTEHEIQFEIILKVKRFKTRRKKELFQITKVLAVIYWGAMAKTHIWSAETKRWVAI